MSKPSQFWRYLDRGMHLYIRRYFYEPVQGNRKTPGWIVIGTAAAFLFTWCWHGMRKGDGIWCFLSVVCLSFEALVTEVRKSKFIKSFEARYLGTPERMQEAAAVLGSPQYLLTIVACLFHLVNVEVSFTVCKRTLFGFPFPLLPVLVAMYSACHISFDALQWEEKAEKRKKS
uniref:Protein-cysteine n-palmitoyltransferase hhat n=1 Tax=Amblyomma triste TaxID=251400 RepID=A0A023G4T8_AMBTT